MKFLIPLFLLPFCTAISSARTWTDKSGRTLNADYEEATSHYVVVTRDEDKREYKIDRSTLSTKDNEYIESQINGDGFEKALEKAEREDRFLIVLYQEKSSEELLLKARKHLMTQSNFDLMIQGSIFTVLRKPTNRTGRRAIPYPRDHTYDRNRPSLRVLTPTGIELSFYPRADEIDLDMLKDSLKESLVDSNKEESQYFGPSER